MTTLYNTFEPTDASDNNYYTNYDESESSTDSGDDGHRFGAAAYEVSSDSVDSGAYFGVQDPQSKPSDVTSSSRSSSTISSFELPAAAKPTTLPTGHREWNDEFQTMAQDRVWFKFYPHMAALATQFEETAFTIGKFIISERALPPENRTIKPVKIGGVAGGDKYIKHGILFKFATDPVVGMRNDKKVYLFGGSVASDEEAVKAASREILGNDRYWGTFQNKLSYPMVVLIDYKGFRLLAMPILPINKSTLKYGSDDGGKTVHADIPELNEIMKTVGNRLNLKGHWTGLNVRQFIYGAGDVEAHLGTDGRYYVLDFARCSAPEAPFGKKGGRGVFSKLLRPEFTRFYKKPLCADAFTRWDADDNDAERNAVDVTEATKYLFNSVVPRFAKRLEQDYKSIAISINVGRQLEAAGAYRVAEYAYAQVDDGVGEVVDEEEKEDEDTLDSRREQRAAERRGRKSSSSRNDLEASSHGPTVSLNASVNDDYDDDDNDDAVEDARRRSAEKSESDVALPSAGTSYTELSDSSSSSSTDSLSDTNDYSLHESTDDLTGEVLRDSTGNVLRRGSVVLPTSAHVSTVDLTRLRGPAQRNHAYAYAYRSRTHTSYDERRSPRATIEGGATDTPSSSVLDSSTSSGHNTTFRVLAPAGGVDVELCDDEIFSGKFGREPRPDGRRVSQLVSEQNACLVSIVASHRVHKAGLNVRHLGRVRAASQHVGLRALILSVCVARVMNQQLKAQMRELMRSLSLPSDEPFKGLCCRYLSMVMRGFPGDESYDNKQSRFWWTTELKRELENRFAHALNEEELDPMFDLRKVVSYKVVMQAFLEQSGLKVTEKATQHVWKSETTAFAFNRNDVIELASRVRATQRIYMARGVTNFVYAMDSDDSDGGRTVRRLLSDAYKEISKGYERSTEGGFPLLLLAIITSERAVRKRTRARRDSEWHIAQAWWTKLFDVWKRSFSYELQALCYKNYIARIEREIEKLTCGLNKIKNSMSSEDVSAANEMDNDEQLEQNSNSSESLGVSMTSLSSLGDSFNTTPETDRLEMFEDEAETTILMTTEALAKRARRLAETDAEQACSAGACALSLTKAALATEQQTLLKARRALAKAEHKARKLSLAEAEFAKKSGTDPLSGVKQMMTMLVTAISPDMCLRLPRGVVALETRK